MSHQVSAVLLAAGLSRRMGRCKQLLPIGDRPAIVRCLETIGAAGIGDVVVVVGPDSDEIAAVIEGFPVTIARNEAQVTEMAESVRTGLSLVNPSASAVLICLSDQPLVRPETLAGMLLLHEREPVSIIIPAYKGRAGHPPLLPIEIVREFRELPTLRDLIGKHSEKVRRFDVPDEGIVLDMDTWEDYQRMRDIFAGLEAKPALFTRR